ncbi:MAG: RsmB/NOP family class I SAM-dependent RNA methyltransferase [Proteobacteria bacterium]|nr:RsmB/NOP family class I SAM-dependent RNA methyltransferase [Pseudomonadota bacterium]
MTPAARLQAAIEILEALEHTAQPIDRFQRDWFRARRYAGSKDRAAIGDRVFDVLRHRASYAWRMSSEAPRALAIAAALKDHPTVEDLSSVFSGAPYAPAGLTPDEQQHIANAPKDMPLHTRGEFPEWLTPELTRAFGDRLLDETAAMQARAPVDLRVNSLKMERAAALEVLCSDGITAEPTPYAPNGIRLAHGKEAAALGKHSLFEQGNIEFQDESAQIAALLCDARPQKRVLDLAAGAGGKSLALAAEMANLGEIVACDVRSNALDQLDARAKRAGATMVRVMLASALSDEAKFDIVLLDAPCSGSGTWRRQPELKWRLTPARLKELTALQDSLLDTAAKHVPPGGRLVYATCSVLPSENEDRITAFRARHPDFAIRSANEVWSKPGRPPAPAGMGEFFNASPLSSGTDGFFTAILVRG